MVGQQVVPSKKASKSGRGTGRGRGRPKGSGKRGSSRGRGGSMAAAEMAGAQAGATAAYAAYGYSVSTAGTPNLPGRSSHAIIRPSASGGATVGGIRMRGPISQGHRFSGGRPPSSESTTVTPTSSPPDDIHVGSTGMGFYVQNSSSPSSP